MSAILALTMALALTACGGDSSSSSSNDSTPAESTPAAPTVEIPPVEDLTGTDTSAIPGLEDGVLTVGMECAYAPYNWTQMDDSNGAVPISNVPGAYANGYDVMIAQPYYYATIVVLTTKDSQYANAASIADLAGGTCTSQSGTIWYDSCLPQIENTNLLAPADSAPAMIMQLQTGAVDYVCTDMPTALAAVAKDDNLVILNFSGTDGDFQFATEEERAENVNIGISVQKGNTQLADAIDTVLSVLNEEQFNALMDQAISIQPEI